MKRFKILSSLIFIFVHSAGSLASESRHPIDDMKYECKAKSMGIDDFCEKITKKSQNQSDGKC